MHRSLKSISLFIFLTLFALPSKAQELYGLSSEEIGELVQMVSESEMAFADLAVARSENDEVKAFGKVVQRNFQAILKLIEETFPTSQTLPARSGITRYLLVQRAHTLRYLDEKKGRDFDLAYLENEIQFHKLVLLNAEEIVHSQGEAGEEGRILMRILPLFKEHLSTAEKLRTQLIKNEK